MKKAIFLAIAVLITGVFTANAQGQGGGGFQRRTVEENVKMVMEKLAPLSLDKDQTTKTDSAFADYYRSRNKMMEEMRGGGTDRTAMREKFEKLGTDRDEKLKKIFSEAQYKKWKEEIEPSMRQRRGGQGGGGN